MNCCMPLSEEEKEERRIHRQIQEQIEEDKKKTSKEVKMLLLGTGESGKSTFVKQMRIIHEKGFSDKERKDYIKTVHQNMFTSMQSMIKAMDLLKINYNIPEIMDSIQQIMRIDAFVGAFDDSNVNALKTLWAFDGIQESYRQRRQYQLSDSTEYFFSNINRVTDPNYIPTVDDILRVRVETKGVEEYDFRSKEYNIRIIDVAGQRTQRHKWFHLFDKCNAMIFISAISEYDQVLIEKQDINRLKESINLFGNIINKCIFKQKPNILFLNKTDLLEEKISKSNLADYFPEYEGQHRDVIAARKFIEKLFVDQMEDKNGTIYTFFTCATDTNNIRNVFKSARSAIIANNIKFLQLN